jgi:hypothetical protein
VSAELLTAVGGVIAAVLGGSGIAAIWRRDPATGPAAEVRSAEPSIVALAEALAASDRRVERLEARVDELEGTVWRCPVAACPVRDRLRREPT